MVWEQVEHEVTRPHVAYAVTGFALVLFGTISLFLKEKLYIGEASVATIYGLIVGPHCLNWFSPTTWGNSDYITLEISRIVLIVQIFAVAVELPKKYMLRHWWSVTMLLLPVMIFGWMVTSAFVWKLVPTLRWIDALCISGCVTATDPVLASAVVGKGKFARRVPGHLRNLLSAESGCNDGMAFPFVILAVYILKEEHHPHEIARDFICIGLLYSCVLGIIIGAVIGYGSRHLIKFAERFNLIDRESFLVYYFCVAFFCAGVGTLCGVDDLLVAFAAGAAFSWDGWFAKQTEESHVSNVIDVLLNTAFFVYFGAIVPWPDFNNYEIGIKAWKLVCLAIIVLVVRRIPIMLAIKPFTPDIHTWREALFCGHFGPIGVGAIFMSLLARAQFETDSETPTAELPPADHPQYMILATIWPITCFLVIASIIVHGSSIALFTLGKRINNMAVTLTYTKGQNEPSWMSRLPRRSAEGGNMLQLRRMETEAPVVKKFKRKNKKDKKTSSDNIPEKPVMADDGPAPGDDQTAGMSSSSSQLGNSIRVPYHGIEQHPREEHLHGISKLGKEIKDDIHDESDTDEDASSVINLRLTIDFGEKGVYDRTEPVAALKLEGKKLSDIKIYREGNHVVLDDNEGNFIHKFDIGHQFTKINGTPHLQIVAPQDAAPASTPMSNNSFATTDIEKSASTSFDTDTENLATAGADANSTHYSGQRPRRRSLRRNSHGRSLSRTSTLDLPHSSQKAFVYSVDDMVVVESADGEILRKYKYVRRGDPPESSKGWKSYLPKFLRKRIGHTQAGSEFEDVENTPYDMLVPEGLPLSVAASRAISVEDEDRVRRRLSKMMRRGEIERRPSSNTLQIGSRMNTTHSAVPSEAVVTDDDDDDDDEDDDAEPETAVERHRRLAALGVIPTNDDDEDELDEIDEAISKSKSNDEDGTEPKITFKLPEIRRD